MSHGYGYRRNLTFATSKCWQSMAAVAMPGKKVGEGGGAVGRRGGAGGREREKGWGQEGEWGAGDAVRLSRIFFWFTECPRWGTRQSFF